MLKKIHWKKLVISFFPCEIWGSHSDDDEHYCLLGCDSLYPSTQVEEPAAWILKLGE